MECYGVICNVCEHFYLREMRDPGLTARTNRRAYVLRRQIAMYIARQLTGPTLEEIGLEFRGRHVKLKPTSRQMRKLRPVSFHVDYFWLAGLIG